ncbi:hypothetical protein ASE21_15390 [Flavobacterium sp. Root901]|uniref:DUF6268 family outer membrane beta-barrel protein n=1 Tax=Flavobacterium sp. Root901 TaxID=1736605 RepID=UPI00070BF89D|nr:DUF6268 family outer membrane beta-barrel protein [Flavobacterium sp. Root901]KRD08081.1 hypothetical protein ASE21_15390 [Flavobacterium sp. Root901]
MKIRFIICLVFLVSFLNVKAQENFSVNVNLKTEPTDNINFTETNIGMLFNKKINSKSQITNTLEYSNLNLNYDLDKYVSFQNIERLQKIQDKLEFSQEITNSTRLNFEVIPTFNFQQNVSFSDFTLLGSFEIFQRLNSKTSLSVGAARTTIFGNAKFLPTASINYKLNDKTDLKIGFPDSRFSYSNNIRNKFIINNSFNGSFYNLNIQNYEDKNASKAVLSQMTTSFEYERNVDKNWFLNFKAGYDFDKKYKLTDDKNNTVHDFNISSGYILGIGIKYKQ